MNKLGNRTRQRGYALVEVLIAAAIAAGVFAAASTAISTSIRLSSRTSDTSHMLYEAEKITARLRAGMGKSESLNGFNNWTIEIEPTDSNVNFAGKGTLQRAILQYSSGKHQHAFEVLMPDGAP